MSSNPDRSYSAAGLRLKLCIGLALGLATATLPAATYTWDGGTSIDGLWTNADNWTASPGGAPARDGKHDLVFAGTFDTAVSADNNQWSVRSLTFANTAGAFTLGNHVLNIGDASGTGGGIVNNSAQTQTINNQIALTAHQTWNAASGAIVTGANQVGGGGKNLTLSGSSAITVGGQVLNIGTLALTGSGNRTFSSTQTTSATTINASSTGTNTFAAQVNATTINLSAGTTRFTNTGTSAQAAINISGTAHATFAGNVAGAVNISSSGDVNFNGSFTSGTLTLNGTGTTRLSANGANNISNTVVNSGTLIMDQTGSGNAINGPLTINNGGTVRFEGDGQIPQWQTVTLNAGSSIFLGDTRQTIQNLIINGDSVIDFGNGGSQLNVTGNISIANDITITILNWNAAAGDSFTGKSPGNQVVHIQYADNNGNIYASGTWGGSGNGTGPILPGAPIPEPATAGFLLLGGAISLVLLRRPRR